jgi:putative membrane protein
MNLKIGTTALLTFGCAVRVAYATPNAADFRHQAMASDAFEIASSKIALGQSNSTEVVAFAKMMIHDHTLTTKHLLVGFGMTQADIDAKVAPGQDGKHASNDLVDQSHADMLDKLGREKGKDFDSDYMSDQVSGHKDAVSLFDDYAKSGDNRSLRTWARQTLPKLKMHLAKAQSIDAKL